ncbi:hypothetical protein EJ08DRAFT_497291 [Tothia fuscella]|uniref:Uncharacterized protein n=1 Tax=Tothia fuscella TaxID=1048955 RepID=A0A9P4U2S2_9PEZI|nr:hypothetical protein EJ08DRAFT_497291 [Tothia fuscella]
MELHRECQRGHDESRMLCPRLKFADILFGPPTTYRPFIKHIAVGSIGSHDTFRHMGRYLRQARCITDHFPSLEDLTYVVVTETPWLYEELASDHESLCCIEGEKGGEGEAYRMRVRGLMGKMMGMDKGVPKPLHFDFTISLWECECTAVDEIMKHVQLLNRVFPSEMKTFKAIVKGVK